MKNRSREEIFASILQAAAGIDRSTKSKIMDDCFLSSRQITKYTQYLIDNELLEYDRQNRVNNIKVKGLVFLELSNKMNTLLKIPQNTAMPVIKWV